MPHPHRGLAALPRKRVRDRDALQLLARGAGLQQQHEAILESGRHRIEFEVMQRIEIVRALGIRPGGVDHESDFAAIRYGIHDAPLVKQMRLQMLCGLAGRRVGHEAASRGAGGHLARRPLPQHSALIQNDRSAAALGLVQIGGAHQHRKTLFGHQVGHDVPQLASRQGIHADRRLIEQQQLR